MLRALSLQARHIAGAIRTYLRRHRYRPPVRRVLEFEILEGRTMPSATLSSPVSASIATAIANLSDSTESIHYATKDLPITFRYDDFTIADLTTLELPYNSSVAPSLHTKGLIEVDGVIKRDINGVYYDYPVGQGLYALSMLNGYRVTGNPEYLKRAELQGRRLLAIAVHSRGAMYFPYEFDFPRHGNPNDLMVRPWYSAMAQGRALSTFVRLYEATGDNTWLNAATLTFNSFTKPRTDADLHERDGQGDAPWTVWVDASHQLWFEEYPKDPPDRTLNGHIYAIFGVLDYYLLTGNANAKLLVQGAISTVRTYINRFRDPGWISLYCLTFPVRSPGYHFIDTHLLYELYTITDDPYFAQMGDDFASDYPESASGTGYLTAGHHTGYLLVNGTIQGAKTVTFSHAADVHVEGRMRVHGDGIFLHVVGGALAGYWVRESPGSAYIRGFVQRTAYVPPRQLTFSAGAFTGYTYAANGSTHSHLQVDLTGATQMEVSEAAIVNGRRSLLVSTGALAGYWITFGKCMSLQ
jgi:hypothetical protein